MEAKFYIGCDISKLTLDFALYHGTTLIEHCKINNDEKEIKELFNRLRFEYNCNKNNSLVCAESMGTYATFLRAVMVKKKYRYWEENALQIKLALGIARGKTDKVDAGRIAIYSRRFYTERFKMWEPPRACILELKSLYNARKKLQKIKQIITVRTKTENYYASENDMDKTLLPFSTTLLGIKYDLLEVERLMDKLIREDVELGRIFEIISSIPCLGRIAAIHLITATNGFKDFENAKKFASYAGIAPFEISSGTSLQKRFKISNLAGKETKVLFHVVALQFARKNMAETPFGAYYQRQLKTGKHAFSILNAIKNKLINQVFYCVRSNQLYQEIKQGNS